MELSPRLLAFLEFEMRQIVEDRTRDSEDRAHASSVLGRIEGEMEWEESQHENGDVDAAELFA